MSEPIVAPVAATDAAVIAAQTPDIAPTVAAVVAVEVPATEAGLVAVEAPVPGEAPAVEILPVQTIPAGSEVDPDTLVETLDAEALKARIEAGAQAMGGTEDLVPDAVDLPPAELRGVIEALLLVATKPLTIERIAKLLPGSQAPYIEGLMSGLADRWTREGRGWDLQRLAGGWQILTRPHFHPWVRQLDKHELPDHLSRSAMETLAIVAYKQPITRGEIEDIRGVQSGPMLRQLMDMKLVQVVGRNEELLGRPLLYGTTEAFLDRFGLGSPADLPRKHELGN